jgi:hypothetical protein
MYAWLMGVLGSTVTEQGDMPAFWCPLSQSVWGCLVRGLASGRLGRKSLASLEKSWRG